MLWMARVLSKNMMYLQDIMKLAKPRAFLSLAILAVLSFATIVAAQPTDDLTLQDARLLVTFDRSSGALTRLEDKSTHWIIERRPELGISFRLHAPLPDRRDNFILGEKQKAVVAKKVTENKVLLEWKDLMSEHGGVLPITFTTTVTLANGALTFDGTLENNSRLTVETVEYPYFGDLTAPTRDTTMQARTMWYGNLESDQIYPAFHNEKGYWGVFYPTKTFDSYRSLFCLIQAPDQGLYVEMHDPTERYLLEYTFEQHPGVTDSVSESVPRQDQIANQPVRLEFRTTHFVFSQPHSTSRLAPVILRTYDGDWHAGLDLYKQWRATWFKAPHIPEWVQDVHSWLQLQINSPEQDYRVPYTELVKYAEECSKNGVKAIQRKTLILVWAPGSNCTTRLRKFRQWA